MSYYYPQASVTLRVVWEDFKFGSDAAQAQVTKLPGIVPKRVSVHINDYTQADTFTLEIDYKNFPFDPRLIRALGVSIFIEDMGTLTAANGLPVQIEPGASNSVFQGFADEETLSFDDSSRTVTFEGRDFTAIFLDAEYPHDQLNLDQPVDDVIQDVVDDLKATGDLTIENRSGVNPLPVLSKFAPDYNATSGAKNVKAKESYWDVIQDVCSRAGLVAYIEIDKLVISKPRAIYSENKDTWRQFVYGKNLKKLEFTRKVGRQKGFNVAVRSMSLKDPANPVITAKIPEEAKPSWLKAIGLAGKPIVIKQPKANPKDDAEPQTAPYLAFLIPKIADKDHLIEVGQQIFEEISRQQLEGSFETREMSVRQGSKESSAIEYDLTKMRIGTPVRIEIATDDLMKIKRLATPGDRVTYLKKRNYPAAVAEKLAETMGKFDTPFYTKAVEFTLDAESGFSMKLEFINFIEVNRFLG